MIVEYFFLKVFVFVVVLRLLRVFDVQSVLLYVLFCFVSFFVMPMGMMPEFLVFCVFVSLFLYVILVSFRNAFRTGFLRFVRHAVSLFYRMKDVFYSVLVVSFIMMVSGVTNWFLLFFGSFFGFLFLSWISKRLNLQGFGVFCYRNAVIVVMLVAFYCSEFVPMVFSVFIGFIYLVLFVIFSFVADTFTFECPVEGLKEGMISAEYVVRGRGNKYYKKSFHSITPQSFLRSRIALRMDKESVVISPLRVLTSQDIDFLKKERKNVDFKFLRVQNTVDMRVFVVMGIFFVILFRLLLSSQ